MTNWFDRTLSVYSKSDLDVQLKARFFQGTGLVIFVMIFILAIESLYVGHVPVLPILMAGNILIVGALYLLQRGYFNLSSHLVIIVCMLTTWAVILFDQSEPLSRLNSFTHIFTMLCLLPLSVYRFKRVIFVYGLLNICFLVSFLLFFRLKLELSTPLIIDVVTDFSVVVIAISFISYYVLSINDKVHNRLKAVQEESLKTNERLQESEEKFSKAFHLSPHLTCIINLRTGEFEDISQSITSVLGYRPDELVGHKADDAGVWENEAEYRKIKNLVTEGIHVHNLEITVRAKDGKRRDLLVSSEYVMIADELQLILVALDITEHKQAESEKNDLENRLRQAQKMEAVGHLAGGIAHDFNNMLSVVMGNTELSLMMQRLDDTLKKRLETIGEAAKRSTDLVRQLLAFARKQTIRPKFLNINDTISGTLNMMQRLIGEGVELVFVPCDDPGKVLIDPTQIDQILANLLVNARDATGGTGRVVIETYRTDVDETYCAHHPGSHPGEFVLVTVSDDGCGMSEDCAAKIFEPFFTTKELGQGTGLGLATVYGIVKQNDGFIYVYSEEGRGTTFKIYLPMCDDLDVAESNAPSEPLHYGAGTILIVEDDPAILEIGQAILSEIGYTVLTAGDPDTALEIAQSHGDTIDLLLTDVVMPKMNGRDLARRIVDMRPGIRCLFMSGYTANVIAHHGVLDDGAFFLAKPFSVRALATKVREVLAVSGSSAINPHTQKPGV